jgi:hypothetical protein
MKEVLIEAFVVGLLTVLVGYVSLYILMHIFKQTGNKDYLTEKSFFITGVLVHLICQYSGINKWYCTNGNACKN